MLLQTQRGFGGLAAYTKDLTSSPIPGSVDDPQAAFEYMMQNGGGCSYKLFTPNACNIAGTKLYAGMDAGIIRHNTESFSLEKLLAGEARTKSGLLFGDTPDDTPIGSPAMTAMLKAAVAEFGVPRTGTPPAAAPPPVSADPAGSATDEDGFPWMWVGLGAGALALWFWGGDR